MQVFFKENPVYQLAPLWVFCESYGGKMTTVFAKACSLHTTVNSEETLLQHLLKAIDGDEIKVNFRGVALGDSWIHPMDYVNTWDNYLYAFVRFLSVVQLTMLSSSSRWWAMRAKWHFRGKLTSANNESTSSSGQLQQIAGEQWKT